MPDYHKTKKNITIMNIGARNPNNNNNTHHHHHNSNHGAVKKNSPNKKINVALHSDYDDNYYNANNK